MSKTTVYFGQKLDIYHETNDRAISELPRLIRGTQNNKIK